MLSRLLNPDNLIIENKIMSNRTKAWRRHQTQIKGRRSYIKNILKKEEKNWKMLYLHSKKLRRARQLGIIYPRKTGHQILTNYEELSFYL